MESLSARIKSSTINYYVESHYTTVPYFDIIYRECRLDTLSIEGLASIISLMTNTQHTGDQKCKSLFCPLIAR